MAADDATARQLPVAVHDPPAAEVHAVRHHRQVVGEVAPAAIVVAGNDAGESQPTLIDHRSEPGDRSRIEP